MIGRWAPSEVLATAAGDTSPVSSRYVAPGRAAGFWAAMWLLTGAAAFGALIPVIFNRDAPVVAADLVYRLVGASFAAFGLIAWHRRPTERQPAARRGMEQQRRLSDPGDPSAA